MGPIVKGQGKSFKFDNSNDKGRALNRRVEMNFNERTVGDRK